jgi:hypothetical protein
MEKRNQSLETAFRTQSAWPYVFGLPLVTLAVWLLAAFNGGEREPLVFVGASVVTAVVVVCGFGFFIVTPNHSRLLVLFGRYRGTVRQEGFYWTNPFTTKHSVSLRAHNMASERIKVNDLLGNRSRSGP